MFYKYSGILFFLAFSFNQALYAQKNYGRVKLIVKSKTKIFWHIIEFKNKDTVFTKWVSPNRRHQFIDGIIPGIYTVRLCSVFYDTLQQTVIINRKAKLKFQALSFYSQDTSRLTFLDQMTENDTVRIFFKEYGDFHEFTGYCFILRKEQQYSLNGKTKEGLKHYVLTESEINTLKQLELNARNNQKYNLFSTISTINYWELKNKTITFL